MVWGQPAASNTTRSMPPMGSPTATSAPSAQQWRECWDLGFGVWGVEASGVAVLCWLVLNLLSSPRNGEDIDLLTAGKHPEVKLESLHYELLLKYIIQHKFNESELCNSNVCTVLVYLSWKKDLMKIAQVYQGQGTLNITPGSSISLTWTAPDRG